MDFFGHAITTTLQHEGGYVNDPADPGGETRYGISKRAFPQVDVKTLTLQQAKALYKVFYWEKGPHLSLYVPKGYLKKGENEIVVFETEGRYRENVTFSQEPVYKD